MALKGKALADHFPFVWRYDSAIDMEKYSAGITLATVTRSSFSDDAQGQEDYDKAVKQAKADYDKAVHIVFDKAYNNAVETLDFAPLLKPGDAPTVFKMRPIAASKMAELHEATPGLDEGRLTGKSATLAFRMSLMSEPNDLGIDGMPKWSKGSDRDFPTLGALVSIAWCDHLDSFATEAGYASITQSLGALAILRSMPRPK